MEENNFQKKRREDSEKRRTPRLKREVTVQYSVKELPQINGLQIVARPHADITRTKDLSETGIFFTASKIIPFQTILDIKLKLPSRPESSVNLEGRVISCKEIRKNLIYGIGAEFFNLNYKQKEALRNFIHLFLKG